MSWGWTCRRASCRAKNEPRKRKCAACGKLRPKKRKPAHMKALEMPYEKFAELNGGERCGICGAGPGSKRLHRDHDHRTGLARGLLCFRCNSALRPYMDAEWLAAAMLYVSRVLPVGQSTEDGDA